MNQSGERLLDALGSTRLIQCEDGLALAEIEHVFVAIWRNPVTKARFGRQRVGLADVVARKPGGAGFLCIIEGTSKPPDDELRRASTEMIASHGTRLSCVAIAIEGSGFGAALTRGVLSGMVLLLPHRKVPVAYFATPWPATRWISEYLPVQSIERFVVSVESVRSRLSEEGPSLR